MNWMSFYQPDLPIAIIMLDNETGEDKERLFIEPASGPLFMTLARLPLLEKASEDGMIVPVSVLLATGLFSSDSASIAEIMSCYASARIVLNNSRVEPDR